MRYLAHLVRALVLLAALSAASGCSHVIVRAYGTPTEGADHGTAEVPRHARTDGAVTCGEKGIYLVDVRQTIGDAAGMILTAGVVPPTSRIEWKCGVPCDGDHVSSDGPATKPRRKSVVSWLWGALPETVSPDCERAYLARLDVSSSFGQRLITVFSLGVASPRTVTWECAQRCVPGVPVIPLAGAGVSSRAGESR